MKRSTTRALAASLATGLALSTLALTGSPVAAAGDPARATASAPSPFLEPYYTEGDLTGDQRVSQADLRLLVAAIGTTSTDPGWADVSAADLDANGVIDVVDLAALAQRVIFDDGSFDLVEASAVDMQKAMNAGVITSVQLTQDYLDRIKAYNDTLQDTSATGRVLNAIISTGGEALAAAAASDAARAAHGGPSSMLDGIPILLKDNYDTKDMPTSAGCSCWEANQTSDDGFMVNGLRQDGAIILGKASMDEFAYGFVSQYSAGSPVGSSKLVASPYNTSQTAGGSSGGTGASISANLGAIGFGTDTGGSIRVPSSYNQLVGLRPTVGLTSRDGIVPLALSQDTGGPIGRSVEDVAIALDAVVGTDPNDAATADADAHVPTSYTADLDPTALRGKSFAYLTTMVPPATATNPAQVAGRRIFLQSVAELEAAGATVTAIDPATLAADPATGVTTAKILGEGSGSTNEFKHDLDVYIARHLDPDVSVRSLTDLVASGKYVPAYQSVYTSRDAVTQATYDSWIGTPDAPGTHAALIRNGKAYLTRLMDDRGLDAFVYPSALPYGTYSTNLRLSPNTGLPAITVPAGQTTAAETLPGANVNLEFLGRAYSEGDLIGDAYSYEQATHHRTSPSLYGDLPGDVVTGPGTDTDLAGTGAVSLAASTASVAPGDTFSVTVDESAADLYAYDVALDYDPSTVQFVSATSGTTGTDWVSVHDGRLTLTHTKLGTSPGAQGATALATVTFKAVAAGSAGLSVASVETVDSTGRGVTTRTPGSAQVTVTVPPGSPDAATRTSAVLRPATVDAGRLTTLTVRVASTTGTPTGRVVVRVAGRTLSRTPALVDGTVRIPVRATRRATGPTVVRHYVKVAYQPSGAYRASSDGLFLRVRRR